MIKKIAKILLLMTGCLFIVSLVFGLVLMLNWPWWTGFFVLLILVGLGVGFVFLRKIWKRNREQHFVSEIIAQDNQQLSRLSAKEKEQFKELQERWKEAIETLNKSHLKKTGNPLYVLPWYMVIGESGSGKTTAIKSARISTTFAETTKVSGISGTRNCDWWFFNQAVIIDTAGRYAIPVEEGRDKEEWQKFLPYLAKYLKKEALNGLIVTVSADKLLSASQEELEQDGRTIRTRADELMLALGTKFPIYVLVTKCDLVQGMTQFCEQLPEQVLSQAMGYINQDHNTEIATFLEHATGVIDERLRNLRLQLVLETESGHADPAILLFPDEFAKLQAGLSAFMKGAFQENPYQETPILRGLFFSSGRQEGTPYSHFLQTLGLIDAKEVLPGTSKGLFLHDFFAKILPRDRGIFAPTRRALEWDRLTRNLGLTSWVALIIALCGLMSFSFVKNLRTLRQIPDEFLKEQVLTGEIHTDVAIMDRFRQTALKIEDKNQHWWIPRFGLNESVKVEQELKKRFSRQFEKGLLARLDPPIVQRMANFSSQTPDAVFAPYIMHLVRRINLLDTFLKTRDYAAVLQMPRPPYKVLLAPDSPEMVAETRDKFAQLYVTAMLWGADSNTFNQEMIDLQKWLVHLLSLKENSLDWILSWVDEQASLAPVTLENFWSGSNPVDFPHFVAPAFTKAGRERISSIQQELENALPAPGPPLIAKEKIEFEAAYRNLYFGAWYTFSSNFPEGIKTLEGIEEWRQMAYRIVKNEGPYFFLLDTMLTEFEPFAGSTPLPIWVMPLFEYDALQKKRAAIMAAKDRSILGKVAQKGQKIISKVEKKTGGVGSAISVEQQMAAAETLLDYRNALLEIVPLTETRRSSYEAAYKVFSDDPATGQSPIFTAKSAVGKIEAQLSTGKEEEKVFWNLLNGPLSFLVDFIRNGAACHLQDLWEEEVLAEVQGISGQRAIEKFLFGESGLAEKYVSGPAAPFLSRSRSKGYYAKEVQGNKVSFTPSFLKFMTKGRVSQVVTRPKYDMTIEVMPTDVNPGAQIHPHATHFIMQCAENTYRIDNFQFPVKKSFAWSSANCGDVTFQIKVADLVLTKMYTGRLGFPKFLNDFRTGTRTFRAGSFSNEAAALKRLGIKEITARYKFSGEYKDILALLHTGPGAIPSQIATCWGQ